MIATAKKKKTTGFETTIISILSQFNFAVKIYQKVKQLTIYRYTNVGNRCDRTIQKNIANVVEDIIDLPLF